MFADASATLLPTITPEIQRGCLSDYLQAVDDEADRGCCDVCGVMVQSTKLEDFVRRPCSGCNKHDFDKCAVEFYPFWEEEKAAVALCSACPHSIHASSCDSIPKFSASNDINTTLCQHYPDCLKDLALVEQFFISSAELIGYTLRVSQKGKPGTSRILPNCLRSFRQQI